MPAIVRNGWKIYFYTAFREIYEDLSNVVESIKTSQPKSFAVHPKVKLLKRIQEIIFDEVPNDPAHARYNLGNTLGSKNRHWRRVKFLDRFRLFFRYHSSQKMIVYVWVNDEKSPRKEGSKKDPYSIFEKRLLQNDPPNDWNELIKLLLHSKKISGDSIATILGCLKGITPHGATDDYINEIRGAGE